MAVQVPVREVVEVLRGRHRGPALEHHPFAIALAALSGVIAPSMLNSGMWIVPWVVLAIAAASEAFAIYEVSPAAIEKRMRFRGRVWKVAVDDVRSITLSWHGHWRLMIETAAGKTHEVPLVGAMHAAFATLYPEIDERRSVAVRQ